MTTYYLRNFVENVSEMPAELARRFKLMRELDEKAHALQAEAEAASRRQLEEAGQKVRTMIDDNINRFYLYCASLSVETYITTSWNGTRSCVYCVTVQPLP